MRTPAQLAALRLAAAQRPDSAQCLHELGNALLGAGELSEAVGCYRQAIALRGDFAEAHNNLGVALKRAGNLEEAIASFGRALELKLNYADAHSNLGIALCMQKKWDAALACFQRAVSLRPDFADAWSNAGNAILAKGDIDQAIVCYQRAIALAPDSAGFHNNLANAHSDRGDVEAAMIECRKALALRGDFGEAHLTLALMLLLQGELEAGFVEYEWRWKAGDLGPTAPNFRQPIWDGSELQGRRILLHAEQGLGDSLQFIRYAKMVAERGGEVILACPKILLSSLRNVDGVERAVAAEEPLGEFAVHCPLLSLPRLFKTSLATIPGGVPYLRADVEKAAYWRRRLSDKNGMKVGLAWAGRAEHRRDRERSFSPAVFAPLAGIETVQLFSLQKKKSGSQGAAANVPMVDWTEELNDFSDTAALVENLDLVITADSAIAHLAGAMGKAVWVLLPYAPDWRWMLHRVDSPWYPTMRLFRQIRRGDWQTPMRLVTEMIRIVKHDGTGRV